MMLVLAKTFSIESRELWYQLRQVYLQESLLRPAFVWGVGLGTLLLIVALLWRDDRIKMTSLLLLAACGLAVLPYLGMREEAAGSPHPAPELAGKATRLRHQSRWVFISVGSLALGTAIWGARSRFGGALTVATLLSGLGATATGVWLAAHDAGAMHFTPRPAVPSASTTPDTPVRSLREAGQR